MYKFRAGTLSTFPELFGAFSYRLHVRLLLALPLRYHEPQG